MPPTFVLADAVHMRGIGNLWQSWWEQHLICDCSLDLIVTEVTLLAPHLQRYARLSAASYLSTRDEEVHITLQLVLQGATLISLTAGFFGVIYTINNYHRQMNAQILMKYTERYERILDQFPPDALAARFDLRILPPPSPHYLKRHGYLAESVWHIWEVDLRRIIASPLLQREWTALRSEFVSHPEFLKYVEQIQKEQTTTKAAHA